MMNDEQVWGEDGPKPTVTVDTETADPRYPTTEHFVTVYCESLDFTKVGELLKASGCKILESRNNVLSHRYFVKGIPNVAALCKGVTIIAWRTAEEHSTLLESFAKRRREKQAS